MPQTWSQFTCLGDPCIILKKIKFSAFAKQKGQSGPSSMFIMTPPVLPAVFLKHRMCVVDGDIRDKVQCGWVH